MSDEPLPLLYLVLGAAGSDRRAVLADLIDGGLFGGARAAVLLCATEQPDAAGDALLAKSGAEIGTWTWEKPEIHATVPENVTHLFLVADGRMNPVDFIEAAREWLAAQPVRFARVLTTLHARLAHDRPELALWFEACLHYADAVLMTKHDGIEAKWITAFEKRYRDQYFPFLFEVVRKGQTKNPAAFLEPEARRVAQVFEEQTELADETDEEVEAAKAENDRFFLRKPGGSRVVEVPSIAPFC